MSTFSQDDSLPPLPLPSLEHTLQRYIESASPHLTPPQLAHTKTLVADFARGPGPQLQAKLEERAAHRRNWLEQWWDEAAYLTCRLPLLPYLNFGGPSCQLHSHFPPQPGSTLPRAAQICSYALEYWQRIRHELVPPQRLSSHSLSMIQWRSMFNTCRIPRPNMDTVANYFNTASEGDVPSHVIVMCGGRIFMFDIMVAGAVMSQPQLLDMFTQVHQRAHVGPGPSVGALAAAGRDQWAQSRSRLISLHPSNSEYLRLIESSVMAIVFEPGSPSTESEVINQCLAPLAPTNRWSDKSLQIIFYENGTFGTSCDHTPFEAMVMVDLIDYINQRVDENGGKLLDSPAPSLPPPPPQELNFKLDRELLNEISTTIKQNSALCQNLDGVCFSYKGFGKQLCKSVRIYSDTIIQLSLQLAYYRLYNRPAPTYETATTRKYFHGRTETVRSCTMEAVRWCEAMVRQDKEEERRSLFLKAVEKHDKLMREAQDNHGCDRHLLGLQMVCTEEGIDTPDLFLDPAYTKSGGGGNYLLSTSFLGYTQVYGGVVPMCEGGYGCFYRVEDDMFKFYVSAWKSAPDTSAHRLRDALCLSLDDTHDILIALNKSKL